MTFARKRAEIKNSGASGNTGSLAALRPTSRRQRFLRLILTYIAVVALCVLLDFRGFDYFEQYAQYVRQGIYERHNVSLAEQARRQIVLVPISDDTFRELSGPPLPRDYQAKVVRDLTRAGAKVIAFDLVFDLPGANDRALISAAGQSKRVLWACLFENEGTPQQRKIDALPELLRASPHEGHILVPQDADIMAVDSLKPVLVDNGKYVAGFSLEAARMALGLTKTPIRSTAYGWQIGNLHIPVDGNRRFKINYQGRPQAVFPSVPYEEIYRGAVDDPFYRDNHFFRDKIVLIGDTSTVGDDHRFTPVGDMNGMEIHAHAIATYLQRGFVIEAPQWLNVVTILLLTALVTIIVSMLRLKLAILGTLLLSICYVFVNIWLFAEHRILLHMVGPGVAFSLMALAVLTQRSLIEEREKHRMEGLLRRYVSPQVASYVIDNPEKCFLGSGEQVTATVLFSDIRGFTVLSEEMTPQQMVSHLNEYFQAMTDVIFAHGGTVDKFMGDAVMAIFGAPVPHVDNERRAVAAAIDMQKAMLGLQQSWQSQGLPTFKMGVGIHTGSMVIGNIGARERLDFTAIGDTVNLACRVEGLSKQQQCGILITEDTYKAIKDLVEVRGPIESSVQGRKGIVVVYEVYGWRERSGLSEGIAR